MKADTVGKAKIYKNGVDAGLGEMSSSSPIYADFEQDITGIVVTDTIELWIKLGTANTVWVKNFSLTAIKSNLW